ncbi:ras-related protein Rac1-like [Euwallacea fornicatus]|uniref:ras-related protein Rac1-like n=1 Tax=Euwallacea fornicatus TaxID=995702 RepID=UPI00338DA5A7
MRSENCVVANADAVGKTYLLTYTTNSFPGEYIPTVFDNRYANVIVNGSLIGPQLWDPAGQEDYVRLRPRSHIEIYVFLFPFLQRSTIYNENVRGFEVDLRKQKYAMTVNYLESSALSYKGSKTTFDEALRALLRPSVREEQENFCETLQLK